MRHAAPDPWLARAEARDGAMRRNPAQAVAGNPAPRAATQSEVAAAAARVAAWQQHQLQDQRAAETSAAGAVALVAARPPAPVDRSVYTIRGLIDLSGTDE